MSSRLVDKHDRAIVPSLSYASAFDNLILDMGAAPAGTGVVQPTTMVCNPTIESEALYQMYFLGGFVDNPRTVDGTGAATGNARFFKINILRPNYAMNHSPINGVQLKGGTALADNSTAGHVYWCHGLAAAAVGRVQEETPIPMFTEDYCAGGRLTDVTIQVTGWANENVSWDRLILFFALLRKPISLDTSSHARQLPNPFGNHF